MKIYVSLIAVVFLRVFCISLFFILQCTEEQWDKIFDTNVKSAFLLTKLAVPEMLKRSPGGSVVYVSSIGGLQPIHVSSGRWHESYLLMTSKKRLMERYYSKRE